MSIKIQKNRSLQKLNTFGLNVAARYFVAISTINDLNCLLDSDEFNSQKKFILGGGSNLLFRKDFDGLVISIEIDGMNLIESKADYIILSVGAGVNWHKFVETCVMNKQYGIENLAYIPGKVGAAPVQNIGAYGVEQSDFFYSLEGILLTTGEMIEISKDDCDFGYRNSIFKSKFKDNFIVTNVKYKLNRQWKKHLKYLELANELKKFSFVQQDVDYVMNTVIRIRKQKLPDPAILGNAGSFFKNPIIDAHKLDELKSRFENVPAYDYDDNFKISAAWLIQKCRWKGKRIGDAGVSEQHSLVLVNYGNATGEDIFLLSEKIISDVSDMFGIKLEREVIIVE